MFSKNIMDWTFETNMMFGCIDPNSMLVLVAYPDSYYPLFFENAHVEHIECINSMWTLCRQKQINSKHNKHHNIFKHFTILGSQINLYDF